MSETSTALTVRAPQALDPYRPRDLNEALVLARTFAASKILGSYGTPEQVMLVMATGNELGIPPTAALRGLYVVEGRVFMSSDLMVALCMRADQCERFDLVEQTDRSAAYTVRRKGGADLTFRWTLDDAARAGLGGKDGSNWKKYPGVMCRHRAAALAARAVFPDVIMGLYEDNEREDVRDAPPAVQPLPAARPAPVDAEVVERAAVEPLETDDQRAERAVARLEAAQTEQERTEIVAEVNGWKLPKGAARDRVAEASKAAKARIARPVVPTPSAATDAIVSGEVFVREEIGSDG